METLYITPLYFALVCVYAVHFYIPDYSFELLVVSQSLYMQLVTGYITVTLIRCMFLFGDFVFLRDLTIWLWMVRKICKNAFAHDIDWSV